MEFPVAFKNSGKPTFLYQEVFRGYTVGIGSYFEKHCYRSISEIELEWSTTPVYPYTVPCSQVSLYSIPHIGQALNLYSVDLKRTIIMPCWGRCPFSLEHSAPSLASSVYAVTILTTVMYWFSCIYVLHNARVKLLKGWGNSWAQKVCLQNVTGALTTASLMSPRNVFL